MSDQAVACRFFCRKKKKKEIHSEIIVIMSQEKRQNCSSNGDPCYQQRAIISTSQGCADGGAEGGFVAKKYKICIGV